MQVEALSDKMIVKYLNTWKSEFANPEDGLFVVQFAKDEPSGILGPPTLILSRRGTVIWLRVLTEFFRSQYSPLLLTNHCNNWNDSANAPVKVSWYMAGPSIAELKRQAESLTEDEFGDFHTDESQEPLPAVQQFVKTEFILDLFAGIHQQLFDSIATQCFNTSFEFLTWLEEQITTAEEDTDAEEDAKMHQEWH